MKSPSPDDLIQSVIDGVNALQKKTFREARSIIGESYMLPPSLPAGDGKSIWITPAGLKAVDQLAALWRKNSVLGKQTSLREARKATAQGIAKLLIAPDFETAAEALTLKGINRAVEAQVAALLGEVTHYFQVHLFRHSGIDTLKIGPVLLERAERWKARVLDMREDDVDRSSPGERFTKAPWVGSVTVRGRTLERSREHAAACLRLALDSVTLPMSISQAREVRGPSDTIREGQTHTFTEHINGFLGWSSSREVFGLRSSAEDVDEFVSNQQGFFNLAGDAISNIVDERSASLNPNLKRRWLESLYWLGESRRDTDDFVALVHLGIALDVLSGGRGDQGIARMCGIIQRCEIDKPFASDGRSIRKLVRQIYKEGRSRIAHGSRYGLLEDLPLSRVDADRFTALILIGFLCDLRDYTGGDDPKIFSERSLGGESV